MRDAADPHRVEEVVDNPYVDVIASGQTVDGAVDHDTTFRGLVDQDALLGGQARTRRLESWGGVG